MKYIFLFFSAFIGYTSLLAQADSLVIENKFTVIAKPSIDGIKLRWAPDDQNHWLKLKDKTFLIYRASFTDKFPSEEKYTLLDSVKLLEASYWESIMDDDQVDEYYKMAGLAAYGDWETLSNKQSSYGNWGQRVEELESRYLTSLFCCDMNFEAARAVGFAYYDDAVSTDFNYVYKVKVAGDETAKAEFKVVRLQNLNRDKDQVPLLSRGVEKEKQVVLKWNREQHKKYTAFHIEKSKDGIRYDRLTSKPYINVMTDDFGDLSMLSFLDSVDNYVPHYYRLIGLDAFGDESKPSKAQKLMGRDRTPPKPAWVDTAFINPDQTAAELYWHFEEVSDDLDKLVIKKAPQAAGPYYPIAEIDKSKKQFDDKDFSLRYLQYYQVCAVDTAGNEACGEGMYCQLRDQVAPAAPQNLKGNIDSAGVVTLTWDLGTEEDLFGYFVQTSNGKGRVFASKTSEAVRDTMWQDTITLHTLTESIYYRVTGIDMRDNYSPFSEIIRLTKPDTIPPRPAVFKNYKVEKNRVKLNFALSSSSDVDSTFLIKKNLSTGLVDRVVLDRKDKEYIDTAISSDTRYTYDLLVVDDAGWETYSPQPITLHTKDIRSGHELAVSHKTAEDTLILELSQTMEGLKYIQVYTGETKEKQLPEKKVKNVQQDMIRVPLDRYQAKYIKLRCFYDGGMKSKYSNVIMIPQTSEE